VISNRNRFAPAYRPTPLLTNTLDIIYMTKHESTATEIGRDRPVEIEITPAMIEAGADLIIEWDSELYSGHFVTPSALAAEVFRRMALMSSSPFD
jgi:hypothetical protein